MLTEGATAPSDEAHKGFGQFALQVPGERRRRLFCFCSGWRSRCFGRSSSRPETSARSFPTRRFSRLSRRRRRSCSSPAISTFRSAPSWGFRPISPPISRPRHPDAGPLLMLMPLAIGAALGALNGLLVAYGRVSPLIATLGTMSVYRGLTYVYARGQEVTSSRLPHWMNVLPEARLAGVPLLVVIAFIVVCLLAAFLRFYPLGRRMYAVGSNVSGKRLLRAQDAAHRAFRLCSRRRPLRPRRLPLRCARGDCDRRPRLRLGADVARGGGHRRASASRAARGTSSAPRSALSSSRRSTTVSCFSASRSSGACSFRARRLCWPRPPT